MIYVLDVSGRAVHFSADWQAATGQSVAEALGYGWLERIHPDDRRDLKRAVGEACAGQLPFLACCRMLAAHRRFVWVSCGARPCFCPDRHACIGLMGAVTELQDQSLAEAWTTVGASGWPENAPASGSSDPIDLATDHLLVAKELVRSSGNRPAAEAIDLTLFLLARQRLST